MDIRLSRAESRVKEAEEFARRSLNERLRSARIALWGTLDFACGESLFVSVSVCLVVQLR